MQESPGWLQLVAAAWSAGADTWTGDGVTVRRVRGGFNNALYRIEIAGQAYGCKLCVVDERHRAPREYAAMSLLWRTGFDIAPEPLHLDESCAILPFPTVVYCWVPGAPLGPTLTAPQLAALLDALQTVHDLRPAGFPESDLPEAWFHWFDFRPYLGELERFLSTYSGWLASADPQGPDLRDRLARLVDRCGQVLTLTAVDPGRGRVPLCLCRVDHNLGNVIWDERDRLRWVDWEFSGWGDPALDLADLRWHESLSGLGQAGHSWLRANYRRPAGDDRFEQRLALWDRLLVTRWPFLVLRWWWSLHYGPDRLRLTTPVVDPAELRARFVRLVERAERFDRLSMSACQVPPTSG